MTKCLHVLIMNNRTPRSSTTLFAWHYTCCIKITEGIEDNLRATSILSLTLLRRFFPIYSSTFSVRGLNLFCLMHTLLGVKHFPTALELCNGVLPIHIYSTCATNTKTIVNFHVSTDTCPCKFLFIWPPAREV